MRHAPQSHARASAFSSFARGFTLIELLVVIGIIAVLIGILLPTLSRARQHSRSVACKAQLQNIGSAFQIYLNENDGWYPPAPYSPTFNPNGLTQINDHLLRHVSNQKEVFRCPADETYFAQYGLSYSYYQELGERRIQQTFFFKILRSASRVPILWDAESFHGGKVPYNWLFADGHVEEFLRDVNPNQWRDPATDGITDPPEAP